MTFKQHLDRFQYECAIASEAESARDGSLPTYDLDQTLERLGLSRKDINV